MSDCEPLPSNLETTSGPHLLADHLSTRRMMVDVLLGLVPVTVAAIWFFRGPACQQLLICLFVALVTEYGLGRVRNQRGSLKDGSVCITALLLAYSLPPTIPWYGSVLGTVIAVALGKMAFGGLGHNLFNPAMVGRAFLMVCFPAAMTQWAAPLTVDATTAATPLAAAKFESQFVELAPTVWGAIPGSLGETSALAIALGGCWLLWRGAGDWRLTVSMLLAVIVGAALETLARGSDASLGVVRHLTSGGVMLGAFFIVTDPVTSPLSPSGRWVFGLLVGCLTMIIRLFAGYPEGVMFAVLIGNAVTPLINRWTAPVPVGGKTR